MIRLFLVKNNLGKIARLLIKTLKPHMVPKSGKYIYRALIDVIDGKI